MSIQGISNVGANTRSQKIDGQNLNVSSQKGSAKIPAALKQICKDIKMFFVGVLGGRVGAKAGHHSILGSLSRIGLGLFKGFKNIARGQAALPSHTYSYDELSKAKARDLLPWVNVARFANGSRVSDEIVSKDQNMGVQIRDVNDPEFSKNLSITQDITTQMESKLGHDARKLLEGLRSICSQKALISPHGAILDPGTGLRVTITKGPDNGYVVGFGCTGGREKGDPKAVSINQDLANIQQYIGFEPRVYDQAKEIVNLAVQIWGKDKVSTAGHSLGGGLAQYSGLYNGVKARCFNASPLGVGLQQILGSKIKQAGTLVAHISMRGDWLSHSGAPLPIGIPKKEFAHKTGTDTRPRILSHLADIMGIRTRGNFGKKYYINFDKDAVKEDYKSKLINNFENGLRKELGMKKPDPAKGLSIKDEVKRHVSDTKFCGQIMEMIDKRYEKIGEAVEEVGGKLTRDSQKTTARHGMILKQVELLAL